jgi:hypothetical protein
LQPGARAHASSGYNANEGTRTMLEPTNETWRTELMSRESSGITVTLLWSRATNLVTVAVFDAASDDYFELVLDEREPALEVFNHPFAYAAARGLEFLARPPVREVLREAA